MSDLQRALKMAEILIQLRKNVTDLTAKLDTAKEDLRRMEQEDLPELMQELGLETFKLASGESIEVKRDVECGISEEHRAKAHTWLVENGFGGLIKTQLVKEFGRGEREAALIEAERVGGDVVERVHPATLKSFIKEQLEAGKTVPFDLFAIHPINRVKITVPKR